MNEKIKIPDNWHLVKLGEVVKIVGGNSAPQDLKYFDKGNIPFVRMQDLGRYHQTYNLTETIDKVNQNAVKEFNMTIFPSKVILIPRSGSVYKNHRAILGCNACVVSHIAVLNPFKNIDPLFLYFYLCIFDMKNIASKTTGLDVISFKDLTQILVPLPPIEDQKRIAIKIQELIQEIEQARNACEKQLKAINDLPQIILCKAFRGEL
jgi:type I restriction enzyme S subunit